MKANMLDWTNAHAGRLAPADQEAFENKAAAVAEEFLKRTGEGSLPYLQLPFWSELEPALQEFKKNTAGFEHMLLLGIGGSALGARALQKAFFPEQDHPGHKGPWLWIADNVDTITLEAWFDKLPADKTIVVVVSKSGGTIETMSQYLLASEWLQEKAGKSWRKHLFFITDSNKGFLRDQARELGVDALPVPDNLGGRYSVLSAVGLVPATFMGLDCSALVKGSQDVNKGLSAPDVTTASVAAHPAFKLASWACGLMDKGYSQLIFFSYIPLWAPFGAWFAQLWAESLGKEGKGSMPLPAVGVTDQHSLQQMFLDGPKDKGCLFMTCPSLPQGRAFSPDLPEKWAFLKGKHFGDLLDAEALGTRMALHMNDVPLLGLEMADATLYNAGKLMGLLETATVISGWLLGINPLDQPAVELGKRLANAKLGAAGYDEESANLKRFLDRPGTAQEF